MAENEINMSDEEAREFAKEFLLYAYKKGLINSSLPPSETKQTIAKGVARLPLSVIRLLKKLMKKSIQIGIKGVVAAILTLLVTGIVSIIGTPVLGVAAGATTGIIFLVKFLKKFHDALD